MIGTDTLGGMLSENSGGIFGGDGSIDKMIAEKLSSDIQHPCKTWAC